MKQDRNNQKWGRMALLLIMAALALSSCVLKIGTLPPTSTSTETEVAAPLPGQGQMDATHTPVPVDTATPAPTETPVVVSVAIVNVELINVHSGPALHYPVIAEITYGEVLRILGRNAQKTWLYVLIPDDRAGWILVEEVEGNFDLDGLPIIQFEPSPTPTKVQEPYGGAILVPPDLDGITPTSARNPLRSALALAAVVVLLAVVFGIYLVVVIRKQATRPSLARFLQIIISLF